MSLNVEKPKKSGVQWMSLTAIVPLLYISISLFQKPALIMGPPPPMVAVPCDVATPIDTAMLVPALLEPTTPDGPCDGYGCGRGYEWFGIAWLPAGSWRLKVKPASPVCVDLLSACDSICQSITASQTETIDWKCDHGKYWYVHFSANTPASVQCEIGRYELGGECHPAYWGPPCDGGWRQPVHVEPSKK